MLKTDIALQLNGDALAEAWRLYALRMGVMADQAVQTHLLPYAVFADICMNSSIEKWRILDAADGGRCVALATFTNDLVAWPAVSPDYFRTRWPHAYAERCVWYCGFVVVADHAPQGTFVQLITGMYHQAAEHGGIIGLDFADANARLARVVDVVLARAARARDIDDTSPFGYRGQRSDGQHYWTYETAALTAEAA
ncbi:hypothetical protein [Dactylosporangium darangshiense]|uniref:N-acetyltransferase domain-containing protein n=1 Tax=Dactylosporangium darangshiense TaxID=579108 RepID=A0ABP8DMW3_9ACTN